MTRDKLIKLKEKALDSMLLCYSLFTGNKPPRPEHVAELQGHASFYQALCEELCPERANCHDATKHERDFEKRALLHRNVTLREGLESARDKIKFALMHDAKMEKAELEMLIEIIRDALDPA